MKCYLKSSFYDRASRRYKMNKNVLISAGGDIYIETFKNFKREESDRVYYAELELLANTPEVINFFEKHPRAHSVVCVMSTAEHLMVEKQALEVLLIATRKQRDHYKEEMQKAKQECSNLKFNMFKHSYHVLNDIANIK